MKSVSNAKLSSKNGELPKINEDPSPPPAWRIIDLRVSPVPPVLKPVE